MDNTKELYTIKKQEEGFEIFFAVSFTLGIIDKIQYNVIYNSQMATGGLYFYQAG